MAALGDVRPRRGSRTPWILRSGDTGAPRTTDTSAEKVSTAVLGTRLPPPYLQVGHLQGGLNAAISPNCSRMRFCWRQMWCRRFRRRSRFPSKPVSGSLKCLLAVLPQISVPSNHKSTGRPCAVAMVCLCLCIVWFSVVPFPAGQCKDTHGRALTGRGGMEGSVENGMSLLSCFM